MNTDSNITRQWFLASPPGFLPIFLTFVLMAFVPMRCDAQDKPEDAALTLQTLQDFHSAEQAAARKPLSEVDESYRSKLTKYQKTSQEGGNLNAVLAAKQALDDLDAGKPASISSDAEVAKIQNAYTLERRKADAAYAKALAKVDQDYLASLKKLVTDLTKGGQIEQAVEVQKRVDQLKTSLRQNDSAANPIVGSGVYEEWKKKAVSEFPDLKDPNSKLSLRVAELKNAKASIPGYFSNPQWPYLLTEEANRAILEEAPASKVQGIFKDGRAYYAFAVDENGEVTGFQMAGGHTSLITGKIEGNHFDSTWIQSVTNIRHKFTYALKPNGDISLEGTFGGRSMHGGTMHRIADQEECMRILSKALDLTTTKEISASISTLKNTLSGPGQ